jgi:hypothetical protein
MSEESSLGEPANLDDAQSSRRPRRRRTTVISFAAGALAAAAIAVVVIVATGSAAQPQRYTGVPVPCTLVSPSTLAKYMPSATSRPTVLPSSSTQQEGGCTWSSISDGEDRVLTVEVAVYTSSSGVTKARQAFSQGLHCTTCRAGRGSTVTTLPVTGVGDQAAALSVVSGAHDLLMGVRSGNADIALVYDIDPIGSAPPLPARAVLLADATAMSRDVLAALAHPAAVTSATAAASSTPSAIVSSPSPSIVSSPSPSQGPQYVNPSHACTLVTPATLARYLPGGTEVPPAPSTVPTTSLPGMPRQSECGWTTPNGVVLSLSISVFNSASGTAAARSQFEIGVQLTKQGSVIAGAHTKVNGSRPVAGLGDQATVILQTTTVPSLGSYATTHGDQLFIWSGNAVIGVDMSYASSAILPTLPSRAEQLTTAVGIARGVLAALPKS